MSPRIEPTLEPAGTDLLRADPARRMRPPPPAPEPVARTSILGWIVGTVLLCIAALLSAIVALRWLPPPTSSYMLQSTVKPVQYQWVPASAIAETARRAVVAAEDQKFWNHQGFDVQAIEQAQQYNLNPRHHRRGASTISQQTAKNMFLWPGGYVRKGIEAGLTVLIEKIWGKNRILEIYLNIAEFGPGIYGVEAAAQTYFGKHASGLSAEEAARLAAVLPNPRHWSVRNPGAYVQSRTAWILGQMGYGTGSAPQEEPQPPPAEAPAADDADDADDPAPQAAAPAPPDAPAADAPAEAPPPEATPDQPGTEAPPAPAAAPPPAQDKPPA